MLNRSIAILALIAASAFTACEKDDPPMADNTIQFEAAEQGLGTDVNAKDIAIQLSRNADAAIPVTIELKETGVVYGTHYTTTPAANAGVITLNIPAGSSSVKFNITKKAGILLNGDESIEFSIKTAGTPTGKTTRLKLSFSSIISTGTAMELQGGDGGASAVNAVYVDLSNNTQTSVARKSFDLKFYTGADFRVLLNNYAGWATLNTNSTDINAVKESTVNLDALKIGFGMGALSLIDDIEGDITKNAMGQVAATDADNKVFLVSLAGTTGAAPTAANVKKIRVLRNGNGYTLQYADLNATSFQTLTIEKNSAYNFQFFSFTNGLVNIEPQKDRWDLVWSWGMSKTLDGANYIPYGFSDLVFTNGLGGAQIAEVLNTTVSYDAYAEGNIAATSFSGKADVIGSNWRNTQGTVGVKTDRFYVVKDAAGNVYKLKWISFHASDNGKRGYPKLEFKLVKKA